MDMPYTTNPHLPRIRLETAKLVTEKGWSTRQAARYSGFNQSTVVRWVQASRLCNFKRIIPTLSSRPHHHPHELGREMIETVLEYRKKYQRCAEVLHYLLTRDGYVLSLSSVKRVLKRAGVTRYSKWKKWHQYDPRPVPARPGILVEIDTIVDGPHTDRLYIYTMLDVCTRWGFALPITHINTHASWEFIQKAQLVMPFSLSLVQSDHGSEFSKWFSKQIMANGIIHRHTRVRRPTDNGHLERFNRTLQEECLNRIPKSLSSYQKTIPDYLHYYNTERPHMALHMLTPHQVMQSY